MATINLNPDYVPALFQHVLDALAVGDGHYGVWQLLTEEPQNTWYLFPKRSRKIGQFIMPHDFWRAEELKHEAETTLTLDELVQHCVERFEQFNAEYGIVHLEWLFNPTVRIADDWKQRLAQKLAISDQVNQPRSVSNRYPAASIYKIVLMWARDRDVKLPNWADDFGNVPILGDWLLERGAASGDAGYVVNLMANTLATTLP